MAFSRATSTEPAPAPDAFTARMVGIGMNFAAEPQVDTDIESTLVHASALGMVEGDLRVLSVLTTWLGVHHAHVNADRLVRRVRAHPSERVRAYWSAAIPIPKACSTAARNPVPPRRRPARANGWNLGPRGARIGSRGR
jgi:hypothetical protein